MELSDIRCFASDVPKDVQEQFHKAIKPGYVRRAALMPDAHLGSNVPVGSVVEMKGFVSPKLIGPDIGCGVSAIQLDLDADTICIEEKEEEVWKNIKERVPIYRSSEKKKFSFVKDLSNRGKEVFEEKDGGSQLGTLGAGNHFIEVSYSEKTGKVWIVVHSGSRSFGHGLYEKHIERSTYDSSVVTIWGREYIQDYNVAIKYAAMNRSLILSKVKDAIASVVNKDVDYVWGTNINKLHNFIERDGDNLIHRKGAISARKGESIIIPGNKIDGCIIGKGIGLLPALNSAAHGAGRLMSRKKAKKSLSLEKYQKDIVSSRVYTGPVIHKRDLVESPDAYKDFNLIIEQMMGKMIKVEDRLYPMVNFKG